MKLPSSVLFLLVVLCSGCTGDPPPVSPQSASPPSASSQSAPAALPPTDSPSAGSEAPFAVSPGQSANALVPAIQDSVASETSDPRLSALTEVQKIGRLLDIVEQLKDAVFVRNGDEHSGKDAAQHLRRKLEAADGKVTTARQFIEHIASGSSLTGRSYEIRFTDGRVVKSAEFLQDELRKLDSGG